MTFHSTPTVIVCSAKLFTEVPRYIYIFRNKTVIFKYLCWSNEHGNQSYTTLVSLLSLNHILIPCHIPVVLFSSSFYVISSVESKRHHREIEEMADIEKSYQWLDKAGLKDSTDAWIMAAQKQPLSKRSIGAGVYHSRQDSMFMLCKDAPETIQKSARF